VGVGELGGGGGGVGLTVQGFGVAQVLLKLLVEVFADADVLEHALQFGRVLEPARLLQAGTTTTKTKTGLYQGLLIIPSSVPLKGQHSVLKNEANAEVTKLAIRSMAA